LARYLTVDDVCRINEAEVGRGVPVDFGLLESAVLRPQSSAGGADAYPDLHSKAAALFHSLVRNHPFLDGNKRTAVLSLLVFYGLNGRRLAASDGDLVDLALATAEGALDIPAIASCLEGWAEPLDLPEE